MAKKDMSRKSVKKTPPPRPAKPRVASHPTPEPKTVVKKKTAASTETKLKAVDAELIKVLNRRTELTLEALVADPVTRHQLWFNPQAEQELWERIEALNVGPLPQSAVRAVFREILSAARAKIRTVRVAYLGPSFSFTHLAALERFGKSADLIPVNTIASVFEEVNRGHAEYGIVPIENSTDGRIVDTLDMFTRLPLRICGEVLMSVHHNLLSRSPRGEITEIYSKPQALSQCRDWLSRNMPQARTIEMTSTSAAAQLARDKPGAAAIATRQAAVQYELQIVAESIEDNAHNVTRFAIIGEEETRPSGRDRTALLLQIPHSPGALSEALSAFKANNINLTWIESFPLRGAESGYLFFLDFEGHRKEPRVQKALQFVEKKAVRMEVLGSYPRSEVVE
ncbi:P-protein [Caulifigura coniformis]|uniref:Bifunctional chorismate mutase/prephenate dehydratase n=1 Tax=Caulifigura coniformis TaxID=2527983 RepID=A0A517SKG1_9PLAN|nr:prephenate dehydratase [Caulifigura coniformis]QDT56604.1 P-protein [Caulifigura coniformis]